MTDRFSKVPIIEALPAIEYDRLALSQWIREQREGMLEDRGQWSQRQKDFLSNWDDFITYSRDGRWDNSANFHLPITMQMVKAVHARFKHALFAVRPWWQLIPMESLDRERLKTIDVVMRWAVQNYVNHGKGIDSAIDDWIWDCVTVGWAVMKRRWDKLQRKAIIVEEVEQEIEANGDRLDFMAARMQEEAAGRDIGDEEREVVAREVEKMITQFDGPVIEPWPHEDFLMPGAWMDVSDLNQPYLIGFEYRLDESALKARGESGLFHKDAVEAVIEKGGRGPGENATSNSMKEAFKREQDRFHGVETVQPKAGVREFRLCEVMCRYDINEDGFNEEIISTIDVDTGEVLSEQFLDRITKTGKRPAHKIDFIRRPRRSYSLGMLELLHPINEELDAMHNMRVDFGTLTNIPFFFYRATSGMKPEKIRIEPGTGYPLDDPNNDVNFPRFQNSTAWGMQEETSLVNWAERLTSVTAMNLGLPQGRVGASRTASGMSALLNEANLNLDVMLGRIKNGYAEVLKGLLADLQERMPRDLKVRVIGADGNMESTKDGDPIFIKPTRKDIAGNLDFVLTANSMNSNRELEKQNAILLSQMLLNPINLQLGIVGPNNVYNINRNVLEKHGVMGIDDFLTKPQEVQTPLSLYDEIAAITQGIVPRIVWHDSHQAKLNGLMEFSKTPEFQEGIEKGINSERSMEAMNAAVGIHQMMLQVISAQAQTANVTGLQLSPTLGARTAGAVGETGRPLTEESIPRGEVPEGQVEGGSQ